MTKTFYRRNFAVLLLLFFLFAGKMQAQQIVTKTFPASAAQGIDYYSSNITGTYTYTQQLGGAAGMQISGIAEPTYTEELNARYLFSHPTFTNSQITAVTLKATYARGNVAPFTGQEPAIVNVNILPCGYSWNTSDGPTLNNIANCIDQTTPIQTISTPNDGDYSTYTSQYLLHDPNYGVDNSSYWSPTGTSLEIGLGSFQDAMNISAMSLIISYAPTLPTVSIIPQTSTSICPGGSVVLTASATGTGLTYLWTAPAGAASGVTSSSYTASVAGVYTVKVTNNQLGTANASATVTVNPLPTAVITPGGSTNICPTGNVALNASAGTSYQWKNNGTVMTGVNNSSYITSTAGKYSVTVTNSYGCSATSAVVPVTVYSAPSATISPTGSASICQGSSLSISANTGIGLNYLWNVPAGATSGVTSSSYTASVAGNYSVTVSSAYGCGAAVTSSATALALNPLPLATITAAGPTTFCQGGNVVLNANTGTGLGYQWYNGVSAISGATNSSYTATITGNYTVKVSNASTGCSASSSAIAVTVNPLPSVVITASGPTTYCQGSSLTLSVPSAAGSTYQWSNNNTAITGATNYNYTSTTAGSYTVSVINSSGCSATSSVTTATTNSTPAQATVTPQGSTVICPGTNVMLSSSITDPSLTYQWYNGTSLLTGVTSTNCIATAAGNYTVTLTNSNKCSSTSAPVTVVQNNVPVVSISPNPSVICGNGGTTLNANSTGLGLSYQWSNSVWGVISGVTSSSCGVSSNGTYNVQVSNSCGAASASTTVVSAAAGSLGCLTYTTIGTTYQAGQAIQIYYASCQLTFNSSNVFSVQLSDESGSFATPTVIGTLTSTSPSGIINAKIPVVGIQGPVGSKYRVRVVASSPAVTGSDNGSDITITSSAGSLSFSSGDMVVVPNNNAAYNFSGNFTVEAWVKIPTSVIGQADIISTRNEVNGSWSGFMLTVYRPNQLLFQINGNNYLSNVLSTGINDGACHNIAVSRSGGTITFYLDGLPQGTQTCAAAISSTSPLYIGYDSYDGSMSSCVGMIDDVQLWNVAKTAAYQIYDNLYTIPAGNSPGLVGYWDFNETGGQVVYDQSVTANNGSLGTNPTAVDAADPARVQGAKCFSPALESGLTFNGATPYQRATIPANANYNFGTADFALEAWVNLTTQAYEATAVASNRNTATNNYAGFLFSTFTGTQLLLQVAGINYLSPVLSSNMQDGNCHHVAVARASGKLQFYLDGSPIGATVNCAGSITNSSTLYIGYDADDNVSTSGNINELRIWNANRTAAQIAASYEAVLSASTPNLVGYWRLNESGDEVIYDESAVANNGYLGTNQFEFDAQNPIRTSAACYTGDRLSAVPFVTRVADSSSSTANEVKIYPNPFSSETNIVIAGASDGQSDVRIFDLQGVTLYTGSISFNKVCSIGQQLPSGMFFVEVIGANNKPQVVKIVKVD